jgi:hypothetical protein
MGMSNSRLAFSDCYELMEKAIEDQKGIRIKFATEQDAWLYRLRLHNARKIDRKDNEEIYEKGHAMHGKSVYDALIMRLRPVPNGTSQCWLRIEKISIDDLEIESLSEAEAELDEIVPPKVPMPLAIDIPTIIKVQPLPFKRRL